MATSSADVVMELTNAMCGACKHEGTCKHIIEDSSEGLDKLIECVKHIVKAHPEEVGS